MERPSQNLSLPLGRAIDEDRSGRERAALMGGNSVNRRLFDWIWHIRGRLALAPGQSAEDAFARLDPLFRQTGTSHERTDDTLTFRKIDPAAQDKMSIFDGGVLRIDGGVLYYRLASRALLYCFLAPLLFLAFAQFTIAIRDSHKPAAEAAGASAKAEKKDVERKLHPIDIALGAPAPEKPKKDGADKSEEDEGPSPTPAYVFAGLFAALYVAGRVLEDRLVKSLFRKRLLGS
jgi:hypothetical protein